LTIRIERRETERGVIVELHGWLREEALADFDAVCASVPSPLLLDIASLTGADEASQSALRLRIHAGARLEGASPYMRLLLETDSSERR
jgi:hypothetical protein